MFSTYYTFIERPNSLKSNQWNTTLWRFMPPNHPYQISDRFKFIFNMKNLLKHYKIDRLSKIVDNFTMFEKKKTDSLSYRVHKTPCGVRQPLQSKTFSLMVSPIVYFLCENAKKKKNYFYRNFVSLSAYIYCKRRYSTFFFLYIHQRSMNMLCSIA